MKPVFHLKLLNGLFEDPCLFVRILREKRAIQFDLGDISRLGAADIFKITDVFVTHMHIDHFIGFDTLLRVILRREIPLNVYGPPNITACVAGKLRGYTWNLIEDYPSVINVFAFDGKSVRRTIFKAGNRFRREAAGTAPSDGVLLETPEFQVRAVKLRHGTPCLAFVIEEGVHINIDKDRLIKMGLPVGPWLTTFKKILRRGDAGDRTLEIEGKSYAIDELRAVADFTRGQKISYATDIAMTRNNVSSLIGFIRDSDIFFCEAYFLEKDRDRAEKRFHLTAKTCGSIAKEASVRKLSVINISPKYWDCPDMVIREAMEEFGAKQV